jgi:hypothetical protein
MKMTERSHLWQGKNALMACAALLLIAAYRAVNAQQFRTDNGRKPFSGTISSLSGGITDTFSGDDTKSEA